MTASQVRLGENRTGPDVDAPDVLLRSSSH